MNPQLRMPQWLAKHRTSAEPGNVEANRRMWDEYASDWNRDGYPGDEWGTPEAIDAIVAEWIDPYISPATVALEIGVGAGRVALRVAPKVRLLTGTDLSKEMLAHARARLAHLDNVELRLIQGAFIPAKSESLDFVYAFDVFVHMDLHTQSRYYSEIARALRPGGHALVHYANLEAAAGWVKFRSQERYRTEGFYFIVPEVTALLARRHGLEVVRDSGPRDGALSHENSSFALVRKPEGNRALPGFL